jgi:hypothetical protein
MSPRILAEGLRHRTGSKNRHQLSGPMASGVRRSERTLKSLKIIKTERTFSLDDCKLPPKMQVMPPTPMNSLYLQACGLVNAACRQPVRMA